MTADPAALLRHVADDAPDADLLARFAAGRDEGAFALLVRRHGGAVFGVCRRMTGHRQDAEDAFQAVFLVLARKADRIDRPELLGNWLYGVAVRVAAKARRRAGRWREATLPDVPQPEGAFPDPDLARVIDEELARLPAWYRDAVLLCDLHGLPRSDAAKRLGVPEGTLSSRLAAGRKKLADRLARRGVTAPAAGLAAALGGSAMADVPAELVQRAVSAAVAGVSGGAVPAAVFHLASGGTVMGTVFGWVGATAAVGLTVGAVAAWPGQPPDASPPKADQPKVAAKATADEPKPTASRVRMIARAVVLNVTELPIWNRDGKVVAAQVGRAVYILDGERLQTRGLVPTDTDESRRLVGFAPDSHQVIVSASAGGRINGSTQLQFWKPDGTGEHRVTEIVRSLHIDRELMPIKVSRLTADSPGAVLALGRNRRRELSVESIDLRTEEGRVLLERTYPEGRFDGIGLSADGKLAGFIWEDERATTVELVELPSGKSLWTRGFPRSVQPQKVYSPVAVAFSPDGSRMLVNFRGALVESAVSAGDSAQKTLGRRTATAPPKREFRVLDTSSGNEVCRPAGQVVGYNVGYGFSHDSRFLVGRVQTDSDSEQFLGIWDATSGRLVKRWDGQAEAVFAPDRPALLIIEHVGSVRSANRGDILGLWDVSPLWK